MRSEAKAISKAIKAKGLQKLRWYCQMCEKQCRDENGFKCHTQSEGHLRQMSIFKEQSGSFMDQFSTQFEKDFLQILSRRHNTKRVRATVVYNEFIQDRNHVHMNSTYWGSLSSFVQYLGREGKCIVDEDEKGWYLAWVDNDPVTLARKAKGDKKKKHDQDDEDRHRKELEKHMAAAKAHALARGLDLEEKFTDLQHDPKSGKIEVGLSIQKKEKKKPIFAKDKSKSSKSSSKNEEKRVSSKRKSDANIMEEKERIHRRVTSSGTAMDSLISKIEQRKRPREDAVKNRSSPESNLVDGCWLQKGIVVKLMDKSFGSLRKQKAMISHVSRRNVGTGYAKLIDKKKGLMEEIEVRQQHLETVIPKLGAKVAVVSKDSKFAGRGIIGKLVDIDIDNYSATVKVLEGDDKGRLLKGLDYENICKLYVN